MTWPNNSTIIICIRRRDTLMECDSFIHVTTVELNHRLSCSFVCYLLAAYVRLTLPFKDGKG